MEQRKQTYQPRTLGTNLPFSWKRLFFQWEWMLLIILAAVLLLGSYVSPYFLNYPSLRDGTMVFLDKALIVFPMAMIMIMRDIDISVGSTVALSSVVMATLYTSAGLPMEVAIIACLATGAVCGLINGLLIVKFKELSAVIVTLGTMILYRGIAYIILKDQAAGGFPEWFGFFGWGYVFGIPFLLIVFAVLAVVFGIVLHQTTFGRKVFAIGNNPTASRFSGIKVDKIKVIVFMLAGLLAAVTAIFLTSRMGSTRPNIATMYELDIIAMAALGGVSTAGGKGRVLGVVIAVFIIGCLQYGLGLINIPSQLFLIIIGALLILSVAIPKLGGMLKKK
ncbi:ABC transporter permease [Terribacillus sp. 179-K 1B1 HS]|uniref:ABC transporter permease n=1 Tax=Terribacillus sp. 179-K 1B1 HS TaxID=3142388 RepID=UPI0039A0C143